MKNEGIPARLFAELDPNKISDRISLLGQPFSKSNNPLRIGVAHDLSPEQLVETFVATGLRHIVQTSTTGFRREVKLASVMLETPEKFLSDYTKYIIEQKTGKEKKLTFSFNSSKERVSCLDKIREFVDQIPGASQFKEQIISLADELFTNAIYNAPIGADGKPLYRTLSRRNTVEWEGGICAKFVICYNDTHLFIACEDPFGSLHEDRFLGHLMKCYGNSGLAEVNMGEGGAGVGMRMIFERFPEFFVAVEEGVKTVDGWNISAR